MKSIHRLIALSNETPRSYRIALAWAYALLLTYLLIMPAPLAPFGDWGLEAEVVLERTLSSYLQHVIAYGGLAAIFWWSCRPATSGAKALVLGGAILHGAAFEGLQYFVPNRYADAADLLCDLAGVLLGAGLMQVVLAWESSLSPSRPQNTGALAGSIPLESGK